MRTITNDEYDFLTLVETCAAIDMHSVVLARDSIVELMEDGGMGSLRFPNASVSTSHQKPGQAVAQGEFDDSDGPPVSYTINVDQDGRLFELDIWCVDFEPLQRLPTLADAVRMLPSNIA